MARHPTYPARWPGSNIIRTVHTAFNWQREDRDSIMAQDYGNCTTLYNQWRSAQRTGEGKGHNQTWPEFRDANTPGVPVKYSHLKAGTGGFRANNGTVYGLSDKADALIATLPKKPGKLLPITASPWNGSKVTPPHAGAFSRAGTQGGDAKIHKPVSKARKAQKAST